MITKYILSLASFFLLTFAVSAQDHDAHAVQLNNGERWEANTETTEGIAAMQAMIAAAEKEQQIEKAELHFSLMQEFQLIFQRCTMKGEAHDQLHNYLLPLRDLLRLYHECEGDDCTSALNDVKAHLNSYGDYFE